MKRTPKTHPGAGFSATTSCCKIPLVYFPIFHDSFLMVDCSDFEDLNTRYRIATLRHGRFVDSLNGLDRTERDKEEAARLEDEMNGAYRALTRHQTEHGCRG
jgi:hypothetical protein